MIALLAGSRLAAHTLQLHRGSPHQLPGLYPEVLDIDRFNLLPDSARELLDEADAELVAVAIPYALAVYEAFVKGSIEMVRSSGFSVPTGMRPLQAGVMHDTFFNAVGLPQPVEVEKVAGGGCVYPESAGAHAREAGNRVEVGHGSPIGWNSRNWSEVVSSWMISAAAMNMRRLEATMVRDLRHDRHG